MGSVGCYARPRKSKSEKGKFYSHIVQTIIFVCLVVVLWLIFKAVFNLYSMHSILVSNYYMVFNSNSIQFSLLSHAALTNCVSLFFLA